SDGTPVELETVTRSKELRGNVAMDVVVRAAGERLATGQLVAVVRVERDVLACADGALRARSRRRDKALRRGGDDVRLVEGEGDGEAGAGGRGAHGRRPRGGADVPEGRSGAVGREGGRVGGGGDRQGGAGGAG